MMWWYRTCDKSGLRDVVSGGVPSASAHISWALPKRFSAVLAAMKVANAPLYYNANAHTASWCPFIRVIYATRLTLSRRSCVGS